jgi:hypothetical protein
VPGERRRGTIHIAGPYCDGLEPEDGYIAALYPPRAVVLIQLDQNPVALEQHAARTGCLVRECPDHAHPKGFLVPGRGTVNVRNVDLDHARGGTAEIRVHART